MITSFHSPFRPTTHPVVAGAEQVGGHEVLRPLKETEGGNPSDQSDAHLVHLETLLTSGKFVLPLFYDGDDDDHVPVLARANVSVSRRNVQCQGT